MKNDLSDCFKKSLVQLLPGDVSPRLALAVSGGADSMALALLAKDYCESRGGQVLALIVDHGLRPEAAVEARLTAARLRECGLISQILTLDLAPGPAVQARARTARYRVLAVAALAAGFVHLALGHHLADQYETVAMRMQRGTSGMEGMASWMVRDDAVFLRPLLGVKPDALRIFLRERGVAWVEDPSNQLRQFERVRIRQDQAGQPPEGEAERVAKEQNAAAFLARHARLYPEGYALLAADSLPATALGALLRTIGGRLYAPKQEALARLAAGLRPATLGGVRLMRAGRLGPGWLLAREPAACAPPVPAVDHARWDERFTLLPNTAAGLSFGALATEASLFKDYKGLPAVVLRGLPALRDNCGRVSFPAPVCFSPPMPMAPRPFRFCKIYA